MTQPKNVTITMRKLSVLNAWESRTMFEFDWRSPETYAKLQTAEAADFAWECLRRNSDSHEAEHDFRFNALIGKRLHGLNQCSLQLAGRSIGAVATQIGADSM